MNISPARIAAYEILLRIEQDGAYSSILLPEYEDSLAENDRGLCHQLVLGVLRKKLHLNAVILHLSGKRRLDAEVEIALRIGLFQLLFLERIPDHSAVNESVNLVIRARKKSAKGFVNALLRRATREEIKLEFADEIERNWIETSHPRWLLERWTAQFGYETAVAIAKANNEIPQTSFRVTPKGRAAGIDVPDPSARLRELADRGQIYFQDEGSQLVGNAVEIPPGGTFLDVCAAPGSKTSQIADRHSGMPKLFVAGDFHYARVESLRRNVRNQGIDGIDLIQYDAEAYLPFANGSFDTILIDAPCSGTGTIRNNPEIRYSINAGDIEGLQRKQLSILSNASYLLRNGGSLIYSTCSLESEENEAVVEQFLSSNSGFQVAKPGVPDAFVTERSFARTFPNRDGMDGFFIAKLIRRD